MAQTRTRTNSQARRRTTSRSNGSSRSGASSRGSSGSTRNRQSRNRNSGTRRKPSPSVKQIASKGKDAVAEGAQTGGNAISTAAGKVKGPAIAGGAALAGLAGGIAFGARRNSGRKVLGMRVGNGVDKAGKNLVDASKNIGRFSENLGAIAAEMRMAREAIDNGSKHRSPIEVVLQGLTARR
jgi:hypothetical protein